MWFIHRKGSGKPVTALAQKAHARIAWIPKSEYLAPGMSRNVRTFALCRLKNLPDFLRRQSQPTVSGKLFVQIYETNRNEQQPSIPILCLFKNYFAFSAISGIFLIRNLFASNRTGKEMPRFG